MPLGATETSPTLDALSPLEKAAVLDQLVHDVPGLRASAESLAVALLADQDSDAVAAEVAQMLLSLSMFELDGRAGYLPERGCYVHEVEAAAEILDEAMSPYFDDLERRAQLGMTPAAAEQAMGIMLGLYRCRKGGPELLLEFAPDYSHDQAIFVLDRCKKRGINLPQAELADLMPDWSNVFA